MTGLLPDVTVDGELSQYLQQLRQYPLLKPQQERELAMACARGDEDAIRKMVCANLRLVVNRVRPALMDRGLPNIDDAIDTTGAQLLGYVPEDEAVIAYGNFIQNVVQFLVIAWVIFLVIKAMNRMNRRRDAKRAAKEAKAKNNN